MLSSILHFMLIHTHTCTLIVWGHNSERSNSHIEYTFHLFSKNMLTCSWTIFLSGKWLHHYHLSNIFIEVLPLYYYVSLTKLIVITFTCFICRKLCKIQTWNSLQPSPKEGLFLIPHHIITWRPQIIVHWLLITFYKGAPITIPRTGRWQQSLSLGGDLGLSWDNSRKRMTKSQENLRHC